MGVKVAWGRYYLRGWPLHDAVTSFEVARGQDRHGQPIGYSQPRSNVAAIRAQAREAGHPYSRVVERMRVRPGKKAWSLDEAIDTPLLSSVERSKRRTQFNQPDPNSIEGQARTRGLKGHTVRWRIRVKGMSPKAALSTPLRDGRIARLAREHGLKYATVYRRLNAGCPMDEALLPLNEFPRKSRWDNDRRAR